MRVREYAGPLVVLTTGMLGFSLFCIVSAAALGDPRIPNTGAIEPQDIVDSAISNISTVAALTVDSIAEFAPTPTLLPSNTNTLVPTEPPTSTATLLPTRTRIAPTFTRERSPSDPGGPPVHIPTRTRTRLPPPTKTLVPTVTNTPQPPPTDPPTIPPPTIPPPTNPPPTIPPPTNPPPTIPPPTNPPPTIPPPTNPPDPTSTSEAPLAP